MKKLTATTFLLLLWLSWIFGLTVPSARADQFKADNNNNLEPGGSWVGGSAPAGNDNAIWDVTVASPANCSNLPGGNTTHTLSSGIDLGNATVNHNGNIGIPFPTQSGYGYQVEYKTNLTDAAWTPLGNMISGDGTIQSVNDMTGGGSRFYRVRIQ